MSTLTGAASVSISHVGGINLFTFIQRICLLYKEKHTLHIFWGALKVGAKDKIRQLAIMVRLTQRSVSTVSSKIQAVNFINV